MTNIDFTQAVGPDAKRAALRASALKRIDAEHAAFLRQLTGEATIEERDTWKTKEEAARAVLAETATEGQNNMLVLEAEGRAEDVGALAATIVAKADAFVTLIGMASKVRAIAYAAVIEATDDSVPVADVPEALDTVFAELAMRVQNAISDWRGSAA